MIKLVFADEHGYNSFLLNLARHWPREPDMKDYALTTSKFESELIDKYFPTLGVKYHPAVLV